MTDKYHVTQCKAEQCFHRANTAAVKDQKGFERHTVVTGKILLHGCPWTAFRLRAFPKVKIFTCLLLFLVTSFRGRL